MTSAEGGVSLGIYRGGVLQEQEFERLGSTYTRHVDVRIVAATNQDLAALAAEKQFRMDLYYRPHLFLIALPPLRRRLDDIPMLAPTSDVTEVAIPPSVRR